jgi:hypothetical protein
MYHNSAKYLGLDEYLSFTRGVFGLPRFAKEVL